MTHFRSLVGAVAAAAILATSVSVQAQSNWPTRPITMIVPFVAGGGIDGSARYQAAILSDILGQNVLVENIGGAAGTLGSSRAAKAAPDGYTFVIGNSGTHAYSQSLYKKRPYDSLADFEAVGLVTESPRILVGRKDLPASGLKELVAYAKQNQSKMQYSSAGVGSGTHLPCALLNHRIGVDITMVPYKGEGPALLDVIAGRMDYMCATIQSGASQVKQGSVKGIAVMAPRRAAVIPELATTGEQGIEGAEATVWNGFFFPRGTPRPIVDRLNKAVQEMLSRKDVRAKLESMGLEIFPEDQRTPEFLTEYLKNDIALWGGIIKSAGISMD